MSQIARAFFRGSLGVVAAGALAACGGGGGAPAGSGGTAPGSGGSAVGSGGSAPAATGGAPGSGGAGPAGTGGAAPAGSGGAGPAGSGGAAVGTGGAAVGSGGAAVGSGGAAGGGIGGLSGTATRPQIGAAQAPAYTVLAYLAQAGAVTAPVTDNWDPTAGVADVAPAMFTVAPSGGTHTSVQAAITAAVAAGGTSRIGINVMPGTYRETVCVLANAPPITLMGTGAAASDVVIVFNNLAGRDSTVAGIVRNACAAPGAMTFGTDASATFAVYGANFQAKNLTIANDGDESTAGSGTQGVALHSRGDKLVFDNVRFLGNQDTILVKTSGAATIARAYFKRCYVEGDVDFICGRGTGVFDGGEIKFVSNRRATGNILAPSGDWRNRFGLLISGANLTSDFAAGAGAGAVTLGRAWDESQGDTTMYLANVATGVYPNGQGLIRESTLGAHLARPAPWAAAATTSRPYSSTDGTYPANRLYEYANTGPGAATP